jgi:TetR/AcrR family transcriptional regulator
MRLDPTRVRNPERTRRAVLDAAERLFAERGYDGVSMRDIGEASGVSQPLIHHHFGCKDALYGAVLRRSADDYAARFPEVAHVADEPADLRGEMSRLFKYMCENESMRRIVGWCRLEGKQGMLTACQELRRALVQRIAEAQRRQLVRADIDPATIAVILEAVLISWFENREINEPLYADGLNDEAFLEQAIAVLERGFAPT